MTEDSTGPLAGIRVIEFGSALTAPLAAGILGDQGASVIKVEPPGIGDILRFVGSHRNGITASFQMANRGKRSIVIDLSTTEGRDIALRLVADADVVVHNMRPGVMERLGLGYADCRAANAELVYCAISGFGHKGPMATLPAYDNIIQAFAGVCWAQADIETREPVQVYQLLADKLTAGNAAQAITAALLARAGGRGGQEITLSMADTVASFLWVDRSGTAAFTESGAEEGVQVSRGVDPIPFEGGYAQCAPVTDAQFAGMFRALGEDISGDPKLTEIGQRVADAEYTTNAVKSLYARHRSKHVDDVIAAWQREDVPSGPALDVGDLPGHPQMQAMETFATVDHPEAGPMIQPRPAPNFTATPTPEPGVAPGLGEHTDAILQECSLGERIATLRADGVVA